MSSSSQSRIQPWLSDSYCSSALMLLNLRERRQGDVDHHLKSCCCVICQVDVRTSIRLVNYLRSVVAQGSCQRGYLLLLNIPSVGLV